ncbi:immunoglobulin superfamily member 1-like [Sardina pilchardus]|uniref:immunoglobulin superfamily member 1-like n=1 Tax=Sardina pilchardus TaxID=27697 RepID=UPI002E10B702
MSMAVLAVVSVFCLCVTSVAGQSYRPYILLSSPYSAVSPGETVRIMCGGIYDRQYKDVCLYRNGSSIMRQYSYYSSSVTFTRFIVDVSDTGSYTCGPCSGFYKSRSISITVVVLQKPSLSLETSREVPWGQSAQMRCSISTQHQGGTFTLQQPNGSFTETVEDTGTSANFTIPQVDFTHEGAFDCQYQTRVSRRNFTSPQSDTISLSVIVVLVQPNISLSAPDGGLFWGPQGPEVTRGHSLSLICSTEPQHQGGSFHLIFDGSNSTRTQLAINHSASFYIPEADYSHQGNYSCVYEVTVSSRTFKSRQTAPLTVIVRASLAPIIASGVISGLFLLLLIPVILYLVKKKMNTVAQSSANRYGFHNGAGETHEEVENIYSYGVLEED